MDHVTPLESSAGIATAIGIPGIEAVLLKREDLHPYGSHKGRSIPAMIERYARAGEHRFVISSSGNAALAAALYVREYNRRGQDPVGLDIFVGNHIASHKLEKLRRLADEQIRVIQKERPLQALSAAMNDGARSLRQSVDDEALVGYEPLAAEIIVQAKKAGAKGGFKVGAVFIGTSSGTTAQALAAHFNAKKTGIQVHIVQTSSCHPMSQEFEPYDGPDEPSVADAIVDSIAHRKAAVVAAVVASGGRGWIVTNDEIRAAQDMAFESGGLEISTNSALSVAGLVKAAELGWELPGAPVCMICGD